MGRKLCVGNLPYEVGETELQAVSTADTVETVNMMRDMATGRARGFAFVEMSTDDEARKAIAQFNEHAMGRRTSPVNKARPKPERWAASAATATGAGPNHADVHNRARQEPPGAAPVSADAGRDRTGISATNGTVLTRAVHRARREVPVFVLVLGARLIAAAGQRRRQMFSTPLCPVCASPCPRAARCARPRRSGCSSGRGRSRGAPPGGRSRLPHAQAALRVVRVSPQQRSCRVPVLPLMLPTEPF